MTTVLSPRAIFGVIVPSTNTVVEAEYNQMRPPGVSWHAGRIWIKNESLDSDESFETFLVDLRTETARAIRDVVTCKPDHIVMGMSAETFWGGAAGNAAFEAWVTEQSGLPVATGAAACREALKVLRARRIGVITPYQPVGDEQVRTFFTDLGFEVAAVHGLKCTTATNIADVTDDGAMLVDGCLIDNVPLAPMHQLKSGPNLVVHFGEPAAEMFDVDVDRACDER